MGDYEYNGDKNIPRSALTNASAVVHASYGQDQTLNLKFTVVSFKADINNIMTIANGNKFTREQMDRINKLKPGQSVILKDVRVKDPTGKEIPLSPVVLTMN